MSTVGRLSKLLFVWRYGYYTAELFGQYVVPFLVSRRGVTLDRPVYFIGIPIVSVVPGSRLAIGQQAVLCSVSQRTALGVNHPVVLRTLRKDAVLEIGRQVRMSGTSICAATRVRIGDYTCIGANVIIADTDFHSIDPHLRASAGDFDGARSTPVDIGRHVFIGAGAFVLKGVSIGDGAFIGAGAVVTSSIPAGAIAAGNPARVLRQLGENVRTDGRSHQTAS